MSNEPTGRDPATCSFGTAAFRMEVDKLNDPATLPPARILRSLPRGSAFRAEVDKLNASVGEGDDRVGQSGLFQRVHRVGEVGAFGSIVGQRRSPSPPWTQPRRRELARSSGLYKSSLAASEFGGGSYRPG